jgi:hypothetical protein
MERVATNGKTVLVIAVGLLMYLSGGTCNPCSELRIRWGDVTFDSTHIEFDGKQAGNHRPEKNAREILWA